MAWIMLWTVAHVPFADHRRPVTSSLQLRNERGLTCIDGRHKRRDTVDVAVRAGQNGGSARRAQRIGREAVVEANAVFGEFIDPWRAVDTGSVYANGMRRVIVRQNEDNVWPTGPS